MSTHWRTPETDVVIHELLEEWETGGYFEDTDTMEELAAELKKDFESEWWDRIDYGEFVTARFIRCALDRVKWIDVATALDQAVNGKPGPRVRGRR
jgi:hypothetical protein